MSAVREWAEALAAWAIPEELTAAVPESPWVPAREMFERRADMQIAEPIGATFREAVAALDVPGTVLDIGVAAGASSLALVGRAPVTSICGVDGDERLLAAFLRRAAELGVPAEAVQGLWPAPEVTSADVVICGNVVYNVPDLPPFIGALPARRRVIVETAAVHPLTELNELWWHFHRLRRPTGPTAADFVAVLAELGIEPRVTHWRRPPEPEYATFADLVDVTRRRLCLPRSRAPEVAEALQDQGIDPAVPPDLGSSGRDLVTVSWPGTASRH